ncbi:MAG: L-seryl-tRNA(Sec) selenium transferase [Candidatus Hydrogenedentes bacterium]|nr:L-seryl-tRNA(Sec) selenium transferase [Candidatus Hydrogenedentota bacterium]
MALSSAQLNAERLSALLRYNEPPIIARIAHDEVLLDMRTLMDGDDQAIVEAVRDVK